MTLRPLDTLDDAQAAVGVIRDVWGEAMPSPPLVRAMSHAAGCAFGAHDEDGRMVGFVLGFAGLRRGLHLHSHMLAAVPDHRSRGVGYALKLAQRAAALEMGIGDVRWTFDPLVARNARFNLCRLGAVTSRWLPNFYGEMDDELNRGDRSDRFEVRWLLAAEWTVAVLAGIARAPGAVGPSLLERRGTDDHPVPAPTGLAPEPGATVAIPRDHLALRRRDEALGRAWREAVAGALDACDAAGLVATWLTDDDRYVFGPGDRVLG